MAVQKRLYWGKHCCCFWFGQNDRRIEPRVIAESLNIPNTVVFRILKENLERTNCVQVLFHTPWHLSKGKFEAHLGKTLSRWPMQTNIFLTNLLREIRSGDLPVTPKQSNRVLNGVVRLPLGQRNWNSKGPTSRKRWQIFESQGVVHKESVPEGKTVIAEFYIGVIDRFLKIIQRVPPAVFCSREFFLVAR